MSETTTPALEIGTKVVEFCNARRFVEAIDQLYAPNIVSVEAGGSPEMPREMNGIEAVRGKSQWWIDNHEVHAFKAEGPFPHGDDKFGVIFDLDVTPKAGPIAGQRLTMRELGVYTVADGKIAREEFYYSMG